jgi:hypothetical protein
MLSSLDVHLAMLVVTSPNVTSLKVIQRDPATKMRELLSSQSNASPATDLIPCGS